MYIGIYKLKPRGQKFECMEMLLGTSICEKSKLGFLKAIPMESNPTGALKIHHLKLSYFLQVGPNRWP